MRKAVIASRSGGGPVAGQRKCSASHQRAGFAKNTLSRKPIRSPCAPYAEAADWPSSATIACAARGVTRRARPMQKFLDGLSHWRRAGIREFQRSSRSFTQECQRAEHPQGAMGESLTQPCGVQS